MSVIGDAEPIEGQEELVASSSVRCENLLTRLELVFLASGHTEVAVGVIVGPPAEVSHFFLGLLLLDLFLSLRDDATFDVAHLGN